MNWKTQLGKVSIGGRNLIGASFGGVPFFVESGDRTGGRRVETHEFPSRDDPYIEDFGRKARKFSVTGYVIGSDYITQRDKLISALESKGPQTLQHPYHGPRMCSCSEFTCTESIEDGGIARFSMSFDEGLELPRLTIASIDPPSLLGLAGDALLLSMQAQMATQYDPSGIASELLAPLVDAIDGLGKGLTSPGSALLKEAQALADFRWRVNGLANRVTGAIRDGAAVYDEIFALLNYAFAPPALPSLFSDLLGLMDLKWATLEQPPVSTASRDKQAELMVMIAFAMRRVVLVRVANLAAEAEIPVYLDAKQVRDQLLFRVDQEAEFAGDEDYYLLQGLRAAIDKAVPRDVTQEKERRSVDIMNTIPSLVFAHNTHGNTSQELAIVAGNAIERPGFIIGGTTVEVIVSA